ncbi:WD40-repeat-containing domain protein [Cladorrhinum sp. PSN259]|nr:WD40-repeat-containing domain protein [Cladorrhinum sp. PSN259]
MGPIRNINHPTNGDCDSPATISVMTSGVPYPQSRRRKRHACVSSSDHPSSPSDSGYASGYISTPENPEAAIDITNRPSPRSPTPATRQPTLIQDGHPTVAGLEMNLDGNHSESDDPLQQGIDDVFKGPSPPYPAARRHPSGKIVTSKKRSVTLPQYSRPRLRPVLHGSGSSDLRNRKQYHDLETGHPRVASFRQPDRFVPARADETNNATEIFRTGRSPNEMTTAEKLLRHNRATEDAFCYRRRVITPMASDYRPTSFNEALAANSWIRAGRVLGPVDQNTDLYGADRQVSFGAVWGVGGVAPGGTAINNGRGQLVRSGTNARLFRTTFPPDKPKADEERTKHGARLAAALGIDRTRRVLKTTFTAPEQRPTKTPLIARTEWNGTEWIKDGPLAKSSRAHDLRQLPTAPFKVLDAPNLRDDFYCSILAYSAATNTLAVGLGNLLYSWSETHGVRLLNRGLASSSDRGESHITSVAFSSDEGGKSILAYARSDKTLGLMSMHDAAAEPPSSGPSSSAIPRMSLPQPATVSCLAWKPTTTERPSRNPYNSGQSVQTEQLLVGNELGSLILYSVEWPGRWEVERDTWPGCFTVLAIITVHTQQICGLAWSVSGEYFASGGNDNLCHLFELSEVIKASKHLGNITETDHERPAFRGIKGPWAPTGGHGEDPGDRSSRPRPKPLSVGIEKYRWVHGAAVKAIAFCPWQEGLVATGGGSNDKCIHFYHTTSGAPLATISVSAQVTSLIWSASRREIAATFGYAQPEHPVRIAVFAWPGCRQVAAIPWAGEHRALYAIPYPSRSQESRGTLGSHGEVGIRKPPSRLYSRGSRGSRDSKSRASMEGCIVVASSDKSVKFHEIWPADSKVKAGKAGILGGSDILESLEGIDRDEAVIR